MFGSIQNHTQQGRITHMHWKIEQSLGKASLRTLPLVGLSLHPKLETHCASLKHSIEARKAHWMGTKGYTLPTAPWIIQYHYFMVRFRTTINLPQSFRITISLKSLLTAASMPVQFSGWETVSRGTPYHQKTGFRFLCVQFWNQRWKIHAFLQ